MPTIAGDAGRDVASNATASAVGAALVLLVVSGLGAWFIARRSGSRHGGLAWFAAFGSIAGCVALTLARGGPPRAFRPTEALAWAASGWDRLATGDLLGSSQFLLNVALFVPAGVAWTWITGRPLRTFGGLLGLTVLIETVQGVTATGGADITDVIANGFGAALGVGAAGVVTFGLRRGGLAPAPPTSRRRRALTAAVLVVVVVIGLIALLAGADRRQGRIRGELEEVFAGTTYEEIAAVVTPEADGVGPPDAGARFVDSAQIFDAVSVRSDGGRYTDGRIELRWPALFFGFRRCVYVTWTRTDDASFRNVSGAACTDFIG